MLYILKFEEYTSILWDRDSKYFNIYVYKTFNTMEELITYERHLLTTNFEILIN